MTKEERAMRASVLLPILAETLLLKKGDSWDSMAREYHALMLSVFPNDPNFKENETIEDPLHSLQPER